MKLLERLKYLLLIVVTSLFFFPFEFTFLPGMNTKMILAALGLVVFIINMAVSRSATLDKDFFVSALFAAMVSLIGVVSVVYNSTNDTTYASYIVSFAVWMGGAYFVVNCIKVAHGHIRPELVINYLIAVCVAQCTLALLIDEYPQVKNLVDSFLAGEGFMGKAKGRLYGIGAALDVAGLKFSAVLILISFIAMKKKDMSRWLCVAYWSSFLYIAVVGNFIGRTTTIGLIIALLYTFCLLLSSFKRSNLKLRWRILPLLLVVALGVPILLLLYKTSPQVRENIRFGFEGFFSLFETGRWETNSNNSLANMVIFPDNDKTWIIGDGYFNNPNNDINFVGSNPTEFYKGTDIGYLRFIFYFGILGLLAFVSYMGVVCWRCIIRHRQYATAFLLLLMLNFLVWFKVSSDIFLVFALFLCVPPEEDSLIQNGDV